MYLGGLLRILPRDLPGVLLMGLSTRVLPSDLPMDLPKDLPSDLLMDLPGDVPRGSA